MLLTCIMYIIYKTNTKVHLRVYYMFTRGDCYYEKLETLIQPHSLQFDRKVCKF